MNTRRYVVPAVLRSAMFVPGQAAGRRDPARVSAAAFTAAGLPVPEHPAQRNIYQLTRRQGLPWSPGLDARIRRRGGELLGHGQLILAHIDCPTAVDGGPLVNAVRAPFLASHLSDLERCSCHPWTMIFRASHLSTI